MALQASSVLQVALPLAHADFAGALCGNFTGAQHYLSNRPASAWNYLHNGTGFDSFMVYTPIAGGAATQALFSTVRVQDTTTTLGFWVGINTAAIPHYALLAGNGTASRPFDQASGDIAGFANAVPTYMRVGYKEAATPEGVLQNKTTAVFGVDSASAPNAGNASATLTLPANGVTQDGKATIRMRSLAFFPTLTASEAAIVRAWIAADAGIVSFSDVLAVSAGRPVFSADYYAVDGVSGKVSAFIDWNDPTHMLVQASSALQVAVPVAHADFAGNLCATFTGAETYVSNAPVSRFRFMHDGTGCSLFRVATPTTILGVHSCACTTSQAGVAGLSFYITGPDVRSSVEKTGGSVYPDSSLGTVAANVPTYREISHGTARAPQWELRAKGTVAASGAYISAPDTGDSQHPLRLASNAGPGLFYVGRWRDLILTPGVSATERAVVQNYFRTAYGIGP